MKQLINSLAFVFIGAYLVALPSCANLTPGEQQAASIANAIVSVALPTAVTIATGNPALGSAAGIAYNDIWGVYTQVNNGASLSSAVQGALNPQLGAAIISVIPQTAKTTTILTALQKAANALPLATTPTPTQVRHDTRPESRVLYFGDAVIHPINFTER
jgi:hypothetical protein